MGENNRKINARKDCSCATSNRTRPIVLVVWTALMPISAPAAAQNRDDFCGERLPGAFEQPTAQTHVGRYVNNVYGYSVDIPVGMQALTGASGPERGFVIPLSQAPRAYLRVDAAYDVFYDITADGVHRRDLNTIRLHDQLLSDQSGTVALAREPGLRAVIRLQCRGGSEILVHEEIIAVRQREIYRLDLQSTPDRLGEDERALNVLLKSWRWEPVH